MENNLKRLFFGWEISAPWPLKTPPGRVLDEHCRHFTLAFLGQTDFSKLSGLLPSFPPPPFRVDRTGRFTECQFFPPRRHNVAAWNIAWFDPEEPIKQYQKQLSEWLVLEDLMQEESREWHPHATLCRRPFNAAKWVQSFQSIPFSAKHIHLYESLGNLKYASIWSYPLISSFEELDHTADIAFRINGESIEELYNHAFTALAFKFPPLLAYFKPIGDIEGIDDIIIRLNEYIAYADQDLGCPFKAVSFHGSIEKNNNILQWDMIVDV